MTVAQMPRTQRRYAPPENQKAAPSTANWQPAPEPASESEFDIRALVWERKWLLFFFAALGAAIGYLEFTKQPPTYRSSATVLVERHQPQLPIEGLETLGSRKDPLDTHVALFNTPVILKRAVEDKQLEELVSLNSSSLMSSIAAGLSVSRSSRSEDILSFSFSCGHPEDAQKVLNAVIYSYMKYLSESQQSASNKTIQLFKEAKIDLNAKLKEIEEARHTFRESSPLLWTSEKGQNIHLARLVQIESQRSELMIQNSQVRAELESLQHSLKRGTSREALLMMADQSRQRAGETGPDSARNASITSQLIPLVLEESMLLEKLGEQHPKVVEIRRRIEVTRDLLSREAGERNLDQKTAPRQDLLTLYMQSLEEELRTNEEKLRELDELFLTERTEASKLAEDENTDSVLFAEEERIRRLYDVVLEKLQGINFVDPTEGLSATVVNQPSPGTEMRAKMFNYAGAGGMGGLAIGLLIGLLLEFSDKRFRSPEEMIKLLGVPILGHIPEMHSLPKTPAKGEGEEESTIAPIVINYHHPNARISEAYRLIRSSLLLTVHGGTGRIIQFTSPDPGDGKSTTCSNIAVATANSGKRTLIVDLDLRRPTIHKLFGLSRDLGVTTFLTSETEWADCIQQTPVPNLDILTAGQHTKQFNELIHSPKLADVLDALREKYDVILLDSPPLLAVSDATSIAPLADSLLLVVKNSKHSRPHAKQARDSLDLVGAPFDGMIVNLVCDETSYRYEGGQYRRGMYGSSFNYGNSYTYHQQNYDYYYEGVGADA